jgi:hypothetical protein
LILEEDIVIQLKNDKIKLISLAVEPRQVDLRVEKTN